MIRTIVRATIATIVRHALDGKVYITDEDGVTTVFRSGPKFELLSENDLGDYTLSSPAVSRAVCRNVMRSPHEMLENGPASMPRLHSMVVARV